MYRHRDWQGALLDLPVNKVVCIGSNYREHIKEIGSAISAEPMVFIRPETALCDIHHPLEIPKELVSVHHEVELAVLIGTALKQDNEEQVSGAIAGYGIALDLMLRERQAEFKKAGQPWEKLRLSMVFAQYLALFRRLNLAIHNVLRCRWRSTINCVIRVIPAR